MHLCSSIFLDSICRYIESKEGELGFNLAYNIDGHLTGRRKPNGSMPCWILLYAATWLSLRRTVSNCKQFLQLYIPSVARLGHADEYSQDKIYML